MNANAPNTASCTTCCVCCKEIPLDAAFTPEGAEYGPVARTHRWQPARRRGFEAGRVETQGPSLLSWCAGNRRATRL